MSPDPRQNGYPATENLMINPPADLASQVKFAVLRGLHAEQAERMATQAWKASNSGEIYIIEDLELRQSFGSMIGRIAHSHHWDIDKIADKLSENVGAGVAMPSDWSVSEKKIACILRCADAIHIDRRRAPSFLYAATKPSGISNIHWAAQNKLAKPFVKNSNLVFSSGSSFKAEDAGAWWLVYDLVKVADKEVRASNALMEEIGLRGFAVQRVAGADSPRSLSSNVRTEGWRPIDAEVRVSDPASLAATLGGRNLYGSDPIAPIRELLQNAADAIRARRLLEDRPVDWGSIRVTVEPVVDDANACWLHIDDNGIGMSERVLAGPLVDFGKSIWNSQILREEFPGLERQPINPIGKFGIGFFSVFELGSEIKVVSKHYQAAVSDAKVLEFSSLSSRPIIRPAEIKELPRDISTRISVKVKDGKNLLSRPQKNHRSYYNRFDRDVVQELSSDLIRLVAMIDIDLEYNDKINGSQFAHSHDVYRSPSDEFIDEILPAAETEHRTLIKQTAGPNLRPLSDEDGTLYGRAALAIAVPEDRKYHLQLGAVSVGGFIYRESAGLKAPYIGAVAGSTDQAARISAHHTVPEDVVKNWATEQGKLLDRPKYLSSQLLRATRDILRFGGDPGDLPYCFFEGRLASYGEVSSAIRKLDRLHIPLRFEFQTSIKTQEYANLGLLYAEIPMRSDVFILSEEDTQIVSEDLARSIAKEGRKSLSISDIKMQGGSLREFSSLVERIWSTPPMFSIVGLNVFKPEVYSPPSAQWVLAFIKPRVNPASGQH